MRSGRPEWTAPDDRSPSARPDGRTARRPGNGPGARMRAYAGLNARPGYGRTWPCSGLSSAAERTVHLPRRITARQIMALVVRPLAAGQGELDLCFSAAEVQRQRDNREAALGHLAGKPVDLFAV